MHESRKSQPKFWQSHLLRVQNYPFWPSLCFTDLKTAIFTVRWTTETSESVASQRTVERGRSVWAVVITF